MGGGHSARKASFDAEGEVDFDHFQILRAIGKGSFGKVCIVQKKDTKKMYAMKYMNKQACIKKDAIRNVLREIDILQRIEHPFLVNLWFAFQDEEDMFMVVDLLMGGDLRYHIQQEIKFDEERVRLYIVEIAMAQDYLRSEHIIHRDIKPDNILLDEEGHVHITDFNIATVLQEGQLATSMSGTKPYMAPEVFDTAVDECPGYSYPVDWWSLGICAYEMLRGKRPYDIHSGTSLEDIRQGFTVPISYSSSWNEGMRNILKQLLTVDPAERISTFEDLKSHPFLSDLDPQKVLRREFKPTFVPAKDHLNCDPTFELEEMIIEAKPLHKKKKRLAKQNSKRESQNNLSGMDMDPLQLCLENINDEFKVYNREDVQREKQEKKRKEKLKELQKFGEELAFDSNKTETKKAESKKSAGTSRKAADKKATDKKDAKQLDIKSSSKQENI